MKTRITTILCAVLGAVAVGVALALPAEAADTLSRLASDLMSAQADPGVLLAEMALPAATKEKIDDIKKNMKELLDPDDGLMAKVGTIEGRLENVKEKIEKRSLDNAEWVDEVNEAIKEQKIKEVMDDMSEELHKRMDEIENLGELGNGKAGGSTGQKIADSFKSAYENASDPVRGKWSADLSGMLLKEITNVSGSAGPAIIEQQQDEIVGTSLREVTIFDLLDSVPVSTDTVDFVRVKAVTDNAGSQPGQGGTVPFSDWTFEEVSKKIETIMMKVRAAQQVLEDEQRLENFVRTELRRYLLIEAENQIITGDGVGNNLLGLVPQSVDYDNNLEVSVVDSPVTDLDRIMVAILQTQRSELPATGILMPYLNWTSIQLIKDQEGRYLFVQPQTDTTPRLWGLPVNPTNALPEGSAHVGNYNLGATFYDRQDTEVMASTEDEDNFQRLLVTFRATMRGQVAVKRKEALVSIPQGELDGTAPTTGS